VRWIYESDIQAIVLLSWAKAGALKERERRLLLKWAKAEKDSKESRKATRSEGDDLDEENARDEVVEVVDSSLLLLLLQERERDV